MVGEVIEIGAVKILGKEISDSFHTYVKPFLSRTVSPSVRCLTSILEKSLRNAPYFKELSRNSLNGPD